MRNDEISNAEKQQALRHALKIDNCNETTVVIKAVLEDIEERFSISRYSTSQLLEMMYMVGVETDVVKAISEWHM